MSTAARPARRRARGAAAVALAAVSVGCGDRSRKVVRLPVPETEWVAVASETRPGMFLSPGDTVRWSIPPGPARHVELAYASLLTGGPGGQLRVRTSAPGRAASEKRQGVSADATRWHPLSVGLPRSGEPLELELAYEHAAPAPETRSLFVAEPSLTVPARGAPRTIVLFVVDTLRADRVGAYGYPRPTTPRLDRFFAQGLRAEKCLTAANWTLPAHASLFTSVPVARHDAGRYSTMLAESFDTLAESLSAEGYRTLAVTGGGLVDASFGLAQGFDRYVGVPESAAHAVRRALQLLREYRKEPVFLFLHTYQLHDYAADEASARELFGGVSALGPGWRSTFFDFTRDHGMAPGYVGWMRNRYDAALRSVDEAFGNLIDGLQSEERLSQTAILLTSDHGEGLCDRLLWGGCLSLGHGTPYLYDEELLVPFEVRIPWRPGARGVAGGNASQLDVAPTLLDAAGIAAPAAFQGRSLLSSPPPSGRPIVSEAPPLESLAARIDDTKLIRRTGVPQKFWTTGGEFVALPVQQSFDLARDPGEETPLASASDWGRKLLAEVDRYLASGFPDSLIVRLPRSPENEGRPIVVSARGRNAAPALRSFGLAARGELFQRGARTGIRFRRPRAPVWLAFQPDESRALDLHIEGLGPVVAANGRLLERGSHEWNGLGWAARESLPAGSETAVFTTPPTARQRRARHTLPADVVTRLLSLGYLAPDSPPDDMPARAGGEAPDASLAPGEVRIERAQ